MPKGVYERTSYHRQRISENHADMRGANGPMFGKHHSEASKKKISEGREGKYAGENAGFYGKHHSEESKGKLRKSLKGRKPNIGTFQKGQLADEKHPNWKGGVTKREYHCKDCGKPICYENALRGSGFCPSCTFKGERCYNWKGGTSNTPYPFNFNEELKELVRKRDDYKCQLCGCPEIENGQKLSIHHIDYNKKNLAPDNLISLCKSCHSKTNFHCDLWKKIFEEVRH